MKKQIRMFGVGSKICLVFSLIIFSCTIYTEGELIGRSVLQEIRLSSPVNESEIREIKFNNHADQYGFKDLYING